MDQVTSPLSRTAALARPGTHVHGQASAASPAITAETQSGAVELSAVAADTLRIEAPVDRARIDAIRAMIARGEYPVDPAAIAKSMIALDLGA